MNDKIKLWKEKTKGLFNIVEWTRFWNYITNLQQENERLKLENKEFKKRLKKQVDVSLEQSKVIEKAVEFIKSTTFFGLRSGKTFMSKYLNELLNILNGSDE